MKTDVGITYERELLSACKRGEEGAFRRLFDEYHEGVLHLALRLCGDMHEAEDITQEVFLKVHRRLGHFEMKSEFRTWLYRITTNLCLDSNRKLKRRAKYLTAKVGRRTDYPADANGQNHSKTMDAEIWRSEMQELLQTALMRIKPKWRTVLVLKDIEGFSYREIGQIAGCSEGTVCSRLNRGRQALRTVLADLGIDKSYFRD